MYNDKIKPCNNWINYSLFVSFFPLLVAGPIERATHLLPQIEKPRKFHYSKAIDGLKQILWGLFKKMVIADNCAKFVNLIFENSAHESGSTLFIGALFFTFQIYCDFSGYSDIALGTARLFISAIFAAAAGIRIGPKRGRRASMERFDITEGSAGVADGVGHIENVIMNRQTLRLDESGEDSARRLAG